MRLTQYIPRLRWVGTRVIDSRSNVNAQRRRRLPQMWYHLGLHPTRKWFQTSDPERIVYTLLFLVPTGAQQRVLRHWRSTRHGPSALTLCGGLTYLADGHGVLSLRRLAHTYVILGNQLRLFPRAQDLLWRWLGTALRQRIPLLPLHPGMLWQFELPLLLFLQSSPTTREHLQTTHPRLLYQGQVPRDVQVSSALVVRPQDTLLPEPDMPQHHRLDLYEDKDTKLRLTLWTQRKRCQRPFRAFQEPMRQAGEALFRWLVRPGARHIDSAVVSCLVRTDWWTSRELFVLLAHAGIRMTDAELRQASGAFFQQFSDFMAPLMYRLDEVATVTPWHQRAQINDPAEQTTYCEEVFQSMVRESPWIANNEAVLRLQPDDEFSGDDTEGEEEDEQPKKPPPSERKTAHGSTKRAAPTSHQAKATKKVRFQRRLVHSKTVPHPQRPLSVANCVEALVEEELLRVYRRPLQAPFQHLYHGQVAVLRPSWQLGTSLQAPSCGSAISVRRLQEGKYKVATTRKTVLLQDLHQESKHFVASLQTNISQLVQSFMPFEPDALYQGLEEDEYGRPVLLTYAEYDRQVRRVVETKQAVETVMAEVQRIFAQSSFLDVYDEKTAASTHFDVATMQRLRAVMTLMPRLTGVSAQSLGIRQARSILGKLTEPLEDESHASQVLKPRAANGRVTVVRASQYPDADLKDSMADDLSDILDYIYKHPYLPRKKLEDYAQAYGVTALDETLKVLLQQQETYGPRVFQVIQNTMEAANANRIANHPMYANLSVFRSFRPSNAAASSASSASVSVSVSSRAPGTA